MKPLISSPVLVEDKIHGIRYEWMYAGNHCCWFCHDFMEKIWDIPENVKSIRVHAYAKSPHADAAKIEITPEPGGGFWLWDARVDETLTADKNDLFSDFHSIIGEVMSRHTRIKKLIVKDKDGEYKRFILYVEVEIVEEHRKK